ncbi:polysaccharide lyase 8 family protein [Streptomyces sp. NPDC005438]|uniref:polysaccharide lyase 8 family protein n=1 Tax=Streptomyces sp. NPDC005438 TaxID=3156880 RepID=UPI0033A3676A
MRAMSRWSRRTLLVVAGAGALALAAPGGSASARTAPRAEDFAALRRRWVDLQLGTGYDPAAEPFASRLRETGEEAADIRARMAPTDDSLFPDLPFDPPAGISPSYDRLVTMASAYLSPGTGHTGDQRMLTAVRQGMAHLRERVYNEDTEPYGNWWEWQIGSPRALLDLHALLYDELSASDRTADLAAVDHFLPDSIMDDYDGVSTGANRVDFCRIFAVRGVLGEKPGKLVLARDGLTPVFPYVTSGDGLYEDGSFIQHTWVAYSGTYGYVLLDGLGRIFALLDGTEWEVTDPKRQVVLDSVENAYAPLMHNGLMMDSVSGRAISRGVLKKDTRGVLLSDHQRGHLLAAAVSLLGASATEAERKRWNALVRGWIERDTALPLLTDRQFEVADLARLHAVAEEDGATAPPPVEHRLFPSMGRAVHRRRDWVANISMAARHVAHYECGNGENPRGWHTGAGMLYWWGPKGTLDQYGDNYWPTVDWYRLPGTTVSTKRLADNEGGEWGEARPEATWVGGVTDGEYAAVGQELEGLGSTLRAHKSWFCVDDAVICLGAGITAKDGVPVETVVDNRNLGEAGTATLTVDGVRGDDAAGRRTLRGVRGAHLAGHGGWVFPEGARLHVLRESRTGAWSDINTGSSTDKVTRDYLTLWLDHGVDPEDASYLYALMPGATPATLAARAHDRHWLRVLANTSAQQAVELPRLGVVAANFWSAGTVAGLRVSAPSSVLLRRSGRVARLALSNPTRSGRSWELRWHRRGARLLDADPGVTVVGSGDALVLRIAGDTQGRVRHCRIRLG